MLSSTTIRKTLVTAGAIGAAAVSGAAIAGAANTMTSSSGRSSADMRDARPERQALSSETAARVRAAALEEVPGATVLRAEAGGPYDTPYHAHIRTSDGARRVVLVNSSFEATDVQADRSRGRGGRRGHRHGDRGGARGETALTGETRQRVEAAVRARYSGATIIRTETNRDDDAPYESHIRTSDGEELEVLVSSDFEVVEAREQRGRR